jgi:ATP-dependent DNA helicase RecG
MTIEKMRAGQRSARNHIIVEVMRDYGDVDARGMGIRTKVIPLTRQFTGRDPDFEVTEDFVKTTIRAKSVPENVPENGKVSLKNGISGDLDDETVLNNPLQVQLLELIQANPHITYDELAEKTGQNRKKIQRQLQVLKHMHVIRRMGAAKGGHWEIV